MNKEYTKDELYKYIRKALLYGMQCGVAIGGGRCEYDGIHAKEKAKKQCSVCGINSGYYNLLKGLGLIPPATIKGKK